MKEPIALSITESSQVGEARRAAAALSEALGLNETQRGKVALSVTEIANNLVLHARQGELILRALQEDRVGGLEILAIDRGPGMADIRRCLEDGYSTAGTPGKGLGAIERLSHLFEIYSQVPEGTVLVSRVWAQSPPSPSSGELALGVVNQPLAGEEVSGDTWAAARRPKGHVVLVADGLGHGTLAAEASREAVRVLAENPNLAPMELLQRADAAMRHTRGAAAAVAELDFERREVRFAGVGNISAAIVTPEKSCSLVSHNGTLGHQARKFQEFVHPWPQGALLVMHSDGLGTQWRLPRYPGLYAKHPSLIAGILYRDFSRKRDDVTVLVTREC